MRFCECEWPRECEGSAIVYCQGCGGDQCICACGGEAECLGCDNCREIEEGDEL